MSETDMWEPDSGDLSDSHGYFIPMVDMMAGVVFILVVLLASVNLVSRDDFTEAAEASAEIQRIQAELDAARQIEQRVLEPRRIADAALNTLLERLARHLSDAGIAAIADPATGRLDIADDASRAADAEVPDTDADARLAAALSTALSTELPCLAPGGSTSATTDCAAYGGARLDRSLVVVRSGPEAGPEAENRASARALSLLSQAVARSPALLGLRAIDGEALLGYRGAGAGATGAGGEPTLSLTFQFDRPPLP